MDMKRFASILLVFTLLISMPVSFAACKKIEGKSEKLSGKGRITAETTTETVPTTTEPVQTSDPDGSTPTSSDDLSKNSQQTTQFDCPVETIGPHEIPGYEYQEVVIEDTEIFNQDGLSIRVNGYSLGTGTTRSLKMHVDNQSGHPVKLSLERIAVDGFSQIPMWMMDFENGSSTDCDLEYFQTLGDEVGIWNPGKFELLFTVEYTDTQATYKTGLLTVYTSLYDPNKTFDFPYAYTFHDADGVKISVLDLLSDKRGGYELLFLLENNTDKDITVRKEESIINNLPVDLFMFSMLSPGEKTIYSVRISADDLKEAKISEIESVGMLLYIEFEYDYSSRIMCNPFTISVK